MTQKQDSNDSIYCGEERRLCAQHTGQDERIKGVSGKLTILIWIVGLMATAIITSAVLLKGSVDASTQNVVNVGNQLTKLEAKLTISDASYQRLLERVIDLEHAARRTQSSEQHKF